MIKIVTKMRLRFSCLHLCTFWSCGCG